MTPSGIAASLRSRPTEWFLGTAIALVVIGVFVALPDLVDTIFGFSDSIVPIGLAEETLNNSGPHGAGITGDHPWFIGFWAVLVLLWAGLPAGLVVAIPAVLWLVMTLGIARYWYRASGLLPALVAAALLLGIGRTAWEAVAAWDSHSGTIFLGVAAVALLRAASRAGVAERRGLLLVALAGAAGGLAAHSDALALLSVVVPTAIALLAVRSPVRRLGAAFVGLLIGYGASAVLARISDIQGSEFDLFLRGAPIDGVGALYNAGSFVWADPRVFTDPVGGSNTLLVVAFAAGWIVVAVAAVSAVLALRAASWGAVSGPVASGPAASGPAAGSAASGPVGPAAPVDRVWVAFWTTALVLVPLSFIASSASGQGDVFSSANGRYLLPWWVAIAALAPLALRVGPRSLRFVAIGAAVVLLLVGGGRLVRNAGQSVVKSGAPAYAVDVKGWWIDNAQRAAKRFGATHGYSGYWTATPLGAGRDVPVYPVMTCGAAPAPQLCASRIASRPSMYRRDRGRSFLVLDQRVGAPPHAVTSLEGIAQRPIGRVDIAPGLTAVFFRGDIGRYVAPYPEQQTTQNGRTG
jgi:hypothetical protein